MITVFFARAISAIAVLMQIRIFSKFFTAEETAQIYFFLAVLSGMSVISFALPNYLAVQSTFDDLSNRKKIQIRVLKLLFVSSLLAAFVGFSLSIMYEGKIKPLFFLPLGMVVFFSNVPTLIANQLFSQAKHARGATVTTLNVVFSQLFAIVFCYIYRTAISWIVGLAVGHITATIIAFYLFRKVKNDETTTAPIATPKISKLILISLVFVLLFGWLGPNFPRLFILNYGDSREVSLILLLSALVYSVVNTVEVLLTQLRRSFWLGLNLRGPTFEEKKRVAFREISIIYGSFGVTAFLFFIVHSVIFKILTGKDISLPPMLSLVIICYEFGRGISSALYNLSESARSQFIPSIILFLGSVFIAANFTLGGYFGLSCTYVIALFAMLLISVCVSIAFVRNMNIPKSI